jgi:hypothetical protein
MAKNEATLYLKIKDMASSVLDEFRDRFVITAGDVVGFAKQMAGAIVDFAKESIAAYREEELAINELTQSMINQGIYTQDLKVKYLQMAAALEAVTTFSDDQIISAESVLQGYIKNTAVTKELLEATLNLAAGKRIDLASAAEMVGKTIGTETDALKRQGIEVKDSTDANQKLANVIDAVNGRFHDAARTKAADLGVMDQLKNSWSNFLENVGALLSPFVTQMAKATKATLDFFNSFAGADKTKMSMLEINTEMDKLQSKIDAIKKKNDQMTGGLLPMNAGDQSMTDALTKQLNDYKEYLAKINTAEAEAAAKNNEIKSTKAAEAFTTRQSQDAEELAYEISLMGMSEEQKLAAQIAADQRRIDNATTTEDKLQAIKEKVANLEKLREMKINQEKIKSEQTFAAARVGIMQSSANLITAISKDGSKAAFIAQKTAALAAAYVAMNLAEAMARSAPPGPPYTEPIARMARVSGMINMAAIGATAVRGLAEGGIVKARPGGMPAIIGEGGQDEAVIPLDKAGGMGFGGGVTIHFNGPIMGNESQAMDFARAIDRSLLKLRQSNQSVAFETDVI